MMPRYWIDVMPVRMTVTYGHYGEMHEERLRVVVWDTETGECKWDVTNVQGRLVGLSNAELRQMAAWTVKALLATPGIDNQIK